MTYQTYQRYAVTPLTSTVGSGAAISLTTTTPANVTSLTLQPGEWSLSGQVDFTLTGATSTLFQMGESVVSAALPTQPGGAGLGTDAVTTSPVIATVLTATLDLLNGPVRLSIPTTTIVYLVASASFSVGTVAAYGTLSARRFPS